MNINYIRLNANISKLMATTMLNSARTWVTFLYREGSHGPYLNKDLAEGGLKRNAAVGHGPYLNNVLAEGGLKRNAAVGHGPYLSNVPAEEGLKRNAAVGHGPYLSNVPAEGGLKRNAAVGHGPHAAHDPFVSEVIRKRLAPLPQQLNDVNYELL